MQPRRALLLTIAVYVSLNLCVGAMPGAFVFELTESVESAQTGRARAPQELAALPPEREGSAAGRDPSCDPSVSDSVSRR